MKLRHRLAVALAGVGLAATTALAAAPSASAGTCYDSMWRIGSRGGCVTAIQNLTNYFYSPDLVTDGIFGGKTDTAVRSVQSRFGLRVDGIVGPQTWRLLCGPQLGDINNPGWVPLDYPIYWARYAWCPGAWQYHY